MKNISPGGGPGAPVIRPRRRTCPPTAHLWYRGASPPMTPHNEGRVKSGDAGPPEPLYLLSPNSYLPQSRPASGGVSRKALLRFRLRASDFLGRQKVTKDRFKDPWSLKISFHQILPLACLSFRRSVSRRGSLPPAAARGQSKDRLLPTMRRLAEAGIEAWARHLPTTSAPTPRRRRASAGGFSSAGSGRNGRRGRGTAARVRAPDASANAQVLSPVMGVLRGPGPMGCRRSGAKARSSSGPSP